MHEKEEGEFTTRIKETFEKDIGFELTGDVSYQAKYILEIVAEAQHDFQKLIITRYGKMVDVYKRGELPYQIAGTWENKEDAPDDAVEIHMVNAEKFIETVKKWFGGDTTE